MSIAFWNINGTGRTRLQRNYMQQYDVLCLQETRPPSHQPLGQPLAGHTAYALPASADQHGVAGYGLADMFTMVGHSAGKLRAAVRFVAQCRNA